MSQSFVGSRRQPVTPAAADLPHLILARRLLLGVVGGALVILAAAITLLSLFASGGLPWLVGVVLAVTVVAVVVAGFHAGGHGWFVPVPVLVLAVAWAIAVSASGWASPTAWALAAVAFAGALVGIVLVVPAIGFRQGPGPSLGTAGLVGATGTATTALTPKGVCVVNNETWTAESLSGPLPLGAPVHVAKVNGLKLLVWSEVGTVPGTDALSAAEQKAEQQAKQKAEQQKEGA